MSNPSAMPDLQPILRAAKRAGEIGAKILTDYFGRLKEVNEKDQAGLVSEADLESEKAITAFLRSEFPDFDILGEEATFRDPGQARTMISPGRWVIDPLDGTTNYVHQFPMYCISIGFEWLAQPVVGVVNVPTLARVYSATLDGGAYCNDRRLRVSDRSEITSSLLATGFSSYDVETLDRQLAIFSRLVREARGIRRAGSAAIDLCMVAEGVFDGYWEWNLQPWDVSAGTLIVREAGGVVTDTSGTTFVSHARNIVAANPTLHPRLLSAIRSAVESAS